MEIRKKIRESALAHCLDSVFASKWFVVGIIVLGIVANFFALEMWMYRISFVVAMLIVVFARDFKPLVPLCCIFYMVTSVGNNPLYAPASSENPSIYLQKNCLIELVVLGSIVVLNMLVRIGVDTGYRGFFSLRQGEMKLSLLLVALGLLLGGIGYSYNPELAEQANQYWGNAITEQGYTFRTLFFGGANAACMAGFYLLFRPMIDWSRCGKEYIFFVLTMLASFVAIQVLYQYCTLTNVFYYTVDGQTYYCGIGEAFSHLGDSLGIDRGKFQYGWGVYNNIGGMLAFMFPAAFYLACKGKYGFFYNMLGNLLYAFTVLSMSRSAILMGTIVYIASVVVVCVKAEYRWRNRFVFLALFTTLALLFLLFQDFWLDLFAVLYRGKEDGFFNDSGRFEIWKVGMLLFGDNPVFGSGFYALRPIFANGITGRFHNTIIQYMASCGVVGTAFYLYHRFVTVRRILTKPNLEKVMLGVCLAGLLLTSLLDCHMFNFGPLIIYSFVMVFLERPQESEKKEPTPDAENTETTETEIPQLPAETE